MGLKENLEIGDISVVITAWIRPISLKMIADHFKSCWCLIYFIVHLLSLTNWNPFEMETNHCVISSACFNLSSNMSIYTSCSPLTHCTVHHKQNLHPSEPAKQSPTPPKSIYSNSIQIWHDSPTASWLSYHDCTHTTAWSLYSHYIASDINQKHSSSYDLYQHPPLGVRARQDLLFNLEQKT